MRVARLEDRANGRLKLRLKLRSRWVMEKLRESDDCAVAAEEDAAGAMFASRWEEKTVKREDAGISGSNRNPDTHILAKASKLSDVSKC